MNQTTTQQPTETVQQVAHSDDFHRLAMLLDSQQGRTTDKPGFLEKPGLCTPGDTDDELSNPGD